MWHTHFGHIIKKTLTVIAIIQEHHKALVHCGSTTTWRTVGPLVLWRLIVVAWRQQQNTASRGRLYWTMMGNQLMRFVDAVRLVMIQLMDTTTGRMDAASNSGPLRLQLKGHQLGCDVVSGDWCKDGSGYRTWSMFLDESGGRRLVTHRRRWIDYYWFNALLLMGDSCSGDLVLGLVKFTWQWHNYFDDSFVVYNCWWWFVFDFWTDRFGLDGTLDEGNFVVVVGLQLCARVNVIFVFNSTREKRSQTLKPRENQYREHYSNHCEGYLRILIFNSWTRTACRFSVDLQIRNASF